MVNEQLTPQHLLPTSLAPRVAQLGNILHNMRFGVALYSNDAAIGLYEDLVNLVFAHLSFPKDPRTMEVASLSIMIAHEHWLRDYGSKNVTRSVPAYLSHESWWKVQESVGDNLHV